MRMMVMAMMEVRLHVQRLRRQENLVKMRNGAGQRYFRYGEEKKRIRYSWTWARSENISFACCTGGKVQLVAYVYA
jgi:hypothetical protein